MDSTKGQEVERGNSLCDADCKHYKPDAFTGNCREYETLKKFQILFTMKLTVEGCQKYEQRTS